MHLKKQDTTYAMAYTTAYFVKRRDNMAKTREATVEICIATLTDMHRYGSARRGQDSRGKAAYGHMPGSRRSGGRAENNIEGRAGRILEIEHIIYIIYGVFVVGV